MEFKRISLSEQSTRKLSQFKAKTKLTPNIACRLALALSLNQNQAPSLELYTDDSGQELNRHTLFGDEEVVLTALYNQWWHDNEIDKKNEFDYFLAHINRGVELLTNRVKGIEDLINLI